MVPPPGRGSGLAARRRSGSGRRARRCVPGRSGPARPSWRARWTVRATSSHITAALTAARGGRPDREDAVVAHQHRPRAVPRSVSTMPRPIESSPMTANGPTGISPPNSSAHREHARDRLAARGPRRGVRRVGVHDAADLGQVAVDVGVRRGVGRRRVLALDDPAVEVADDHVLRRELVVGDAARLDHEQVVTGHAGRDVAGGPHHEPVADQLGVQRAHLAAQGAMVAATSAGDGHDSVRCPSRRRQRGEWPCSRLIVVVHGRSGRAGRGTRRRAGRRPAARVSSGM